jgi:hypothetical protein
VISVSLVTVFLWCGNSVVQQYTGEMGVLAILPLVAFFGFGVLNKDDFNGCAAAGRAWALGGRQGGPFAQRHPLNRLQRRPLCRLLGWLVGRTQLLWSMP